MKLIPIIGAYLFVGLLLIQAFQVPIIYVNFKLHQDYITKNLCENRYEAIPVCRGKCVLRKELRSVVNDNPDHNSNIPSKIKIENSLYCFNSQTPISTNDGLRYEVPQYGKYSGQFTSSYITEFFVPPRS